MEGWLAGEEGRSVFASDFPYRSREQVLDVIVAQLASLQGHEIVQEDIQVLHRLDSS